MAINGLSCVLILCVVAAPADDTCTVGDGVISCEQSTGAMNGKSNEISEVTEEGGKSPQVFFGPKILLSVGLGLGCAIGVMLFMRSHSKKDDVSEEEEERRTSADVLPDENAKVKPRLEDISKDVLYQMLEELTESHDKIKDQSKMITQELLATPSISFEETYQRVTKILPDDPLDRLGLSMMDFDTLLDRHQKDPEIRRLVAEIMGASTPASDRVATLTVKEITVIHEFMLDALKHLTEELQQHHELRTVTIAVQCILNAKLEAKFNVTSEDLEIAVLKNHTELATDADFVNVSVEMQSIMGTLLGGSRSVQ